MPGPGGGGGGGGSDVTLGAGEYVINYSAGGSEPGTGVYTPDGNVGVTVVNLTPGAATPQEHPITFHPGAGALDVDGDGLAIGTHQLTDSYDSTVSSSQVVWNLNLGNSYSAPFTVGSGTGGTVAVSGTITVTEASTDLLFATFEEHSTTS